MRLRCLISILFFLNNLFGAYAQTNVMCVYAASTEENFDAILNAMNTKMVLRDSLSYTTIDGKTIQNDTSKIILPDSCTLVLLYDIKYAFMSKPALKYLQLIEKLDSFGDKITNNYLFEVVQELSLTMAFLNFLGDQPELKNTNARFFSVLAYSEPDSECILNVKKWLKKNPAKKEMEFYKSINLALESKKNTKAR